MNSLEAENLAKHIVTELKGTLSSTGGLCRCPAHPDKTASLSVRGGRSNILVKCFGGCDGSDVMAVLRDKGLLDGRSYTAPATNTSHPASKDFADLARSIWSSSSSINGTIAQRYLESRTIETLSDALRFNRSLTFNINGERRTLPGFVAKISNDDTILGIQRNLLTRDGRKAPIEGQKRILGRPFDGSVRLSSADDSDTIGLGEGIETCMSAARRFKVPTWATLGTENFASVSFPAHIRRVLLFVDNGKGGNRAEALFLKRDLPNLVIETHRPPSRFSDWNDLDRFEHANGNPLKEIVQ